MTKPRMSYLALVTGAALAMAVAGCSRDDPGTAVDSRSTDMPPPAADPVPAGPVALAEVSEATPDYMIGISYPESAERYPGVAAAMKAYADAARAELMEAVAGRRQLAGPGDPPPMYDLSLAFSELLVTPAVAAYAADGSTYTGGAHGMPLVARFVWLPQQQRMLTAERLVPTPAGWADIAGYIRGQLHEALPARVDATGLEAEDRQQLLRTGARMIDEGTAPEAGNFDQFEPLAGAGGRLSGLRFIFPPYQVAPYSEGVLQVDVPAPVLLPVVAPELRNLFEGGLGSDVPGAEAVTDPG
ncbi:RsiV family protein [Lysobacter sp. GX 14042]|uniref:RsiV family protein n=1 Tax=Lysobacter sp. GX 14042 TaxID=2907155 RepID=UPI001F2E1F22|nr:RsiV family protein [Lysobacter sp. GX 14042]MCE7031545.1 RsiV family protein [Lysobacter sp. GX 14042]